MTVGTVVEALLHVVVLGWTEDRTEDRTGTGEDARTAWTEDALLQHR